MHEGACFDDVRRGFRTGLKYTALLYLLAEFLKWGYAELVSFFSVATPGMYPMVFGAAGTPKPQGGLGVQGFYTFTIVFEKSVRTTKCSLFHPLL